MISDDSGITSDSACSTAKTENEFRFPNSKSKAAYMGINNKPCSGFAMIQELVGLRALSPTNRMCGIALSLLAGLSHLLR